MVNEYTHRNGETDLPTEAGHFWFVGFIEPPARDTPKEDTRVVAIMHIFRTRLLWPRLAALSDGARGTPCARNDEGFLQRNVVSSETGELYSARFPSCPSRRESRNIALEQFRGHWWGPIPIPIDLREKLTKMLGWIGSTSQTGIFAQSVSALAPQSWPPLGDRSRERSEL